LIEKETGDLWTSIEKAHGVNPRMLYIQERLENLCKEAMKIELEAGGFTDTFSLPSVSLMNITTPQQRLQMMGRKVLFIYVYIFVGYRLNLYQMLMH
jgi:hypothetical protein